MVSERGLDVLRAIVQDYVATREPVGSKGIVDRHSFGVSAATIRNDMALLEDEELIAAPHTSSGRIPTDKGYRVFVDHLSELRPLTPAQRGAIASFLMDAGDLDDVLIRTVRALTSLTGQMALVQYPSFARARVSHVEVVDLHGGRILLIVVTDAGSVSQRIVTVRQALVEGDAAVLRDRLGAVVTGKAVGDAVAAVKERRAEPAAPEASDPLAPILARLLDVLGEELDDFRQDRLVMAGAANLARREADFRGSISPVLDAIEEQVTVLRLMSEMVAGEQGIAASIGRENSSFGLEEASIVSSDYDANDTTARVGLIGPTRMDYPTNMAAVRAVARYLSRLLDEDDAAR